MASIKILEGEIKNVKNDLSNHTISVRPQDVKRKCILIDAKGVVVGRLCSYIANVLKGKNLSSFTPHVNHGNMIVVINCKDVVFTGNKETQHIYYHHTGYPGGLKERTAKFVRSTKPEDMIRLGVKRMLSKGALRNSLMKNLRLFADEKHTHEAQNPVLVDFKSMNRKNSII